MSRAVLKTAFVAAVLLAAAAPARAQVAVVSVKSLNAARTDFIDLASLAMPRKEAEKQWQEFLEGLPVPDVGTLDPGKPLGLYFAGVPGLGGKGAPTDVFFAPLKSEKAFLGSLKELGLEPRKGEDSVYRTDLPNGATLAFRFVKEYAYLSGVPDLLAGRLPDPATLAPADEAATASVSLRPDRLTKDDRNRLREFVNRNLLEKGFGPPEQLPDEPDAAFKFRSGRLKFAGNMAADIIDGTAELTVSLGMDRKQGQLVVDAQIRFTPETEAAKQWKKAAGLRSAFSRAAEGAPVRVVTRLHSATALRDGIGLTLQEIEALFLPRAEDEREKAMIRRIVKALAPSLESDYADLGLFLQQPAPDKPAVLLGGLRLKKAGDIEGIVSDGLKKLPPDAKPGLKWNHARHAGAVIHLVEDDAEPDPLFGKPRFYFAFLDEAVVFGIGEEGLPALKGLIDALSGKGELRPEPVEFDVDLLALATLAARAEGDERRLGVIRKAFPDPKKTPARFRLAASWGETARVRATLDLAAFGLFKLLEDAP
jgi:hypothetical protein